jgi:stage IV sporulation protein A
MENSEGLWNTNIFGKTIEQIVSDSINDKIRNITDDNMDKLRETLQKVMNENTGIVCLIV